jgi:immune inhibitor A
MIVVLVGFQDEAGKQSKIKLGTTDYMQNLLFSKGTRKPVGSLSDYYRDVSGGIITSMTGKIVGPYVLPQKMSYYANKESGRGLKEPNSQTMANHTLDILIREGIDLTPFDHDQRAPGYVDALVIVHAGKAADEGGEGKESNIWSVKWNLPAERTASGGLIGTKVYSFLTIAENAELGVVAHEVGHLVFGWPDLYDTGNPTKKPGIGNWCLMANGSWLGDPEGTCPPHPSAWCKMQQGWVNVVTDKADSTVTIGNEAYVKDLKDPNRLPTIRKLWSNGYAWGDEYFLLEVRQKLGYDIFLPGEGLLGKFLCYLTLTS